MVEVGIGGPMAALLAWMCAATLLAAMALLGRVGWICLLGGVREGAGRVLVLVGGLALGLGLGVVHFVGAPRALHVESDGSWTVTDAFGFAVARIPADEERQVKLTSRRAEPLERLEVRRVDGRRLTLYGLELRAHLGYRYNQCGAWWDRPLWRPHRYGPAGPRCPKGDHPETARVRAPAPRPRM